MDESSWFSFRAAFVAGGVCLGLALAAGVWITQSDLPWEGGWSVISGAIAVLGLVLIAVGIFLAGSEHGSLRTVAIPLAKETPPHEDQEGGGTVDQPPERPEDGEGEPQEPESDEVKEESPLSAAFDAARDRNPAAVAEALTDEWVAAGETDSDRLDRKAFVVRMRGMAGDKRAIDELEAMAAEHPDAFAVIHHLVSAIVDTGDHRAAAAAIAERVDGLSTAEQAVILDRKARSLRTIGELGESESASRRSLDLAPHGSDQWRESAETLADTLIEDGRPEEALVYLEQILMIDPTRAESRFTLAFRAGRLGLGDIATAHYAALRVSGDASDAALNNLGHELEAAGATIESVRLYKEAVENGSALAASNLMYMATRAGFRDIGEHYQAAGLAVDPAHERVHAAAQELSSRIKKDAETFKELKRSGELRREDLRKVYALMPADLPSGDWFLADGTPVTFELSDDGGRAVGSSEGNPERLVAERVGGLLRLTEKPTKYSAGLVGFGAAGRGRLHGIVADERKAKLISATTKPD